MDNIYAEFIVILAKYIMIPEISQNIDQEFSKYPMRSYPKGQIIIFAGENPDCIYYLAKGKVRKYDVSYRGDEVVVNIFKSPSLFPMSWAINKTTNQYFYRTEEPTQLHVVPVKAAIKFIKSSPEITIDVVGWLYLVINGLQGRIVQLMSGTARSRLLYELIVECQRFGKLDADGHHVLAANESDLAARSGLSRETVSREMSKLKSQGLAGVRNRVIVINDLPGIEKKFGSKVSI